MSPPTDPRGAVTEVRSVSGSLLARIVDGSLEFKCRRSRNVVRVSLRELMEAAAGGSGTIWVGPGSASTSPNEPPDRAP